MASWRRWAVRGAALLLLCGVAAGAGLATWIGTGVAGQATPGASLQNVRPLPVDIADLDLPPPPKTGNRKLDSHLNKLVDVLKAYGQPGAEVIAQSMALSLEDGAVRVVVEAMPGRADGVIDHASSLGIPVEATYKDWVQLLVPVALLEPLAGVDDVAFVRLPWETVPLGAITGEGVSLINADDWHAAGFTGAGVKVAVLDLGFYGYESLLGTELPSSVATHSCRADQDISGSGERHGTAVAEIVHDVAPDAQLVFANSQTEVEFANCVSWLKGQDVDIVNFSAGWVGTGPGDGTGVVNEVVDDATAAGIIWVNAAGNYAQQHWMGPWYDPDNDMYLNISARGEGNPIAAAAGEKIQLVLKWDDPFGASCNDYDLWLVDSTLTLVAVSDTSQAAACYAVSPIDPVEALSYLVPADDRYYVLVWRFGIFADGLASFHLYSLNHDLGVRSKSGSISEPADNPDVLTVGAVAWNNASNIEDYSSRGPTDDGRTKPDIVGPARVSGASYGPYPQGFAGTSASAPHVAGAAALVEQWHPEWSQEQTRSFLASRAIDLGARGADNTYGAGRLDLGDPKWTPTPTRTRTPIPPAASPTPTVTRTPSNTPTPSATPTRSATLTPEPPPRVTLTVGSGAARIGGERTVILQAPEVEPPGLGSWTIEINYDSSVIAVQNCQVMTQGYCDSSFGPSTILVSGTDSSGLSGFVNLARLTFRCIGVGDSPLTLKVAHLAGPPMPNSQSIEADLVNGLFICERLMGDAGCDGVVNAIDAARVLQFVAGLVTAVPCPDNADVNGDRALTAVDATLILQYDARLIRTFPASALLSRLSLPW